MKKHPRRKYFVDPQVQGALILRILGYWVASFITVICMLLTWSILSSGSSSNFSETFSEMWSQFKLPLVAGILLLPLFVYDLVRMTNRFVGPLYRLRREMQILADGESPMRIQFRSDDFWQDIALDFNAIANRIECLERQAKEGSSKSGTTQPEIAAPAASSVSSDLTPESLPNFEPLTVVAN
jgi:hypothetical protein